MKILIFSDSHGRSNNIIKTISLHTDAKYIFFLGDGDKDITAAKDKFPSMIFYCVRGNNDFYSDEPDTREVNLCGHKVFMAHGHTMGVKYGLERIISEAIKRKSDIVLFGHTHEKYYEYTDDSMYVFNPGTCGEGYFGHNSFGILTIDEKNVLFSFGEIL